jgi:AAA ATPase domain
VHHVRVLLGEPFDHLPRRPPDQQRPVVRVGQGAREQQLAALVRRLRQGEVLFAEGSTAVEVVVDQRVLEDVVFGGRRHVVTVTRRPASSLAWSAVGVGDQPQLTGSLAGRLGRAGERSFVGRDGERELVAAALAADEPPFAVLVLHGPGGVGKTALLRRMCLDAEAAGVLAVAVDARTLTPSPVAFVAAIGRELGLPADEDPVPVLREAPRLLLAVDTFEQCAVLQGWLRQEFLPRLPADAVTVLAGREPPEAAWRFDPGWQDLLRVVAVRNLPPADAAALLAARGVPDSAHAELLAFAGGHPLALCLLAELVQRGEEPNLRERGTPDVVRTLLERFVDEAPSPRHRAALEVCAHARVTTESLLRGVLGDPGAGELFAWLHGRSFVEHGAEGLYPHDLARDVLDTELRWRDPDRYTDLHRRLREYLVHRMAGPDSDAARYWRDSMFLHRRNPVFAPFLSWQVESGVYADDPRPGDRPAVLAMAAVAEGDESAAIPEH